MASRFPRSQKKTPKKSKELVPSREIIWYKNDDQEESNELPPINRLKLNNKQRSKSESRHIYDESEIKESNSRYLPSTSRSYEQKVGTYIHSHAARLPPPDYEYAHCAVGNKTEKPNRNKYKDEIDLNANFSSTQYRDTGARTKKLDYRQKNRSRKSSEFTPEKDKYKSNDATPSLGDSSFNIKDVNQRYRDLYPPNAPLLEDSLEAIFFGPDFKARYPFGNTLDLNANNSSAQFRDIGARPKKCDKQKNRHGKSSEFMPEKDKCVSNDEQLSFGDSSFDLQEGGPPPYPDIYPQTAPLLEDSPEVSLSGAGFYEDLHFRPMKLDNQQKNRHRKSSILTPEKDKYLGHDEPLSFGDWSLKLQEGDPTQDQDINPQNRSLREKSSEPTNRVNSMFQCDHFWDDEAVERMRRNSKTKCESNSMPRTDESPEHEVVAARRQQYVMEMTKESAEITPSSVKFPHPDNYNYTDMPLFAKPDKSHWHKKKALLLEIKGVVCRCQYCGKYYNSENKPRVLFCGHTFCQNCVVHELSRYDKLRKPLSPSKPQPPYDVVLIICTSCQQSYSYEPEDLKHIPTNWILLETLIPLINGIF